MACRRQAMFWRSFFKSRGACAPKSWRRQFPFINQKAGTFIPADHFKKIFYVRAAGFLAAWSRIVVRTLFGTRSKVNGSIEYDARPFDSERMAVA